jgi:hypothetical protein
MNVLRSRYRRARVAARRVLEVTVRDEIAESDGRDELERMLRPLNRQQRSALVLTSMLGYSAEEAGTLLGDISPLPAPSSSPSPRPSASSSRRRSGSSPVRSPMVEPWRTHLLRPGPSPRG